MKKLTDEAVEEWRAHPVTEAVMAALDRYLLDQEEQCKAAAWEGNPWSDVRRLAARLVLSMWWDVKEEPASGINRMLGIEDGETSE
jgi:uncharacterized phage-associated protein